MLLLFPTREWALISGTARNGSKASRTTTDNDGETKGLNKMMETRIQLASLMLRTGKLNQPDQAFCCVIVMQLPHRQKFEPGPAFSETLGEQVKRTRPGRCPPRNPGRIVGRAFWVRNTHRNSQSGECEYPSSSIEKAHESIQLTEAPEGTGRVHVHVSGYCFGFSK
jgi:hypothetical protein